MKNPNFQHRNQITALISNINTSNWLIPINNIPIRKRLILVFLTTSIVPIALMGVISHNISKEAVSNKIGVYAAKELIQTNKNLELVLQKYEDFSVQLGTTQELSQLLEALNTPGTFESHMAEIQKLQNVFQSSFSLEKTFLGSAFYPAQNSGLIINTGSDAPETIKRFGKTADYQRILAGKAKEWVFYDGKFFMVAPVYNTFNGSFLGVCVVFLNQDGINKLINFTIYNDEEFSEDKLGTTPYMIAVSKQGAVAISPFSQDIGRQLTDLAVNSGLMNAITAAEGNQNQFSEKIGGRKVMLTFNALDNGNFYLLELAPYSFLYAETALLGWWALGLGLLIGAVVVGISIVFAQSVSQPLTQVMLAMKRAEEGDLSVRVDIASRDELGQLGTSFNRMLSRIKNMIAQTKEAITEVVTHSHILESNSKQSARTAEAISLVTQEISKGTAEQTVEAEKTSLKMDELAKQIETVVSKSQEMEQISVDAKKLSLASKAVTDKLLGKAQETDYITNAFAKDITELNKSAGEIRNITDLITRIAEQTNLLALNAAIEAARAGDYGLGFAVVADEVNKLAVQTQNAARMIEDNLNKIVMKTQVSAKTAERAHVVVEEQFKAVCQAQESNDAITEAMNTIVLRISDVNDYIRQMNQIKDNTINSISSISAVSEENAASAEEVNASSQEQASIAEQVSALANELLNMADKLVEIVSVFKD